MIWSLQKKIEKRKPELLEEMIFALHFFFLKTGNSVIGAIPQMIATIWTG